VVHNNADSLLADLPFVVEAAVYSPISFNAHAHQMTRKVAIY
jgi:hypothetical protein